MYILIWKTFDPQGKIFHLSLVMLLNSPWSRLHRRCHVPCKNIRGLKIWVFLLNMPFALQKYLGTKQELLRSLKRRLHWF